MQEFVFPKSVTECNQLLQVETSETSLRICLVYSNLTNFAVGKLFDGLRRCRNLYHLDLSYTGINELGAAAVADFLKVNTTVTVLNLDGNLINSTGGGLIADSLEVNRRLSILTLRENQELDKQVVRPFLAALKVNKVLFFVDLGTVESIRIKTALSNNQLFRAVLFDDVLSKPDLNKTRFNMCKVSLIGAGSSGKTKFLEALISNQAVSKPYRRDTKNSLRSTAATLKNNLKIDILHIRTDKYGRWKKTRKHCDFLAQHALRTANMLLTLKPKANLEEEGKKKSLLSQFNSKRKQSTFTTASDTISEVDSEIHRTGTMHSMTSFKTLNTLRKSTIRKTRLSKLKSKGKRNNSLVSDAFSGFGEDAELLLNRATNMSVSTGTTSSSVSQKEQLTKDAKEDTSNLITKTEQGESPLMELDLLNVVLSKYVDKRCAEFNTEAVLQNNLKEGKAFEKLRKKFQKKNEKTNTLRSSQNNGRRSRLSSSASTSSQGKHIDYDYTLRAVSIASRKRSHLSSSSSENSVNKVSIFKDMKKSRIKKLKANPYMTRHFDDKYFINVKSQDEALNLSFWEFSENSRQDAKYTSIISNFLSRDPYGLTIICFDMKRLLSGKKAGRKVLVYYLKLARAKSDAKIILIGTRLDQISHQDLNYVNAEVKQASKEASLKRLIINSKSKLLFYPVDVLSRFGCEDLRHKITKICKNLEKVKCHLSLKDFALLDFLTMEKKPSLLDYDDCLDFKEVVYWGEALGIDRVRLEKKLKLFHEQGLILFFPRLRSIENKVLYKVEEFAEKLCSLCNVQRLNKSYDKIYNSRGYEKKVVMSSMGYKKNYLLARPMIEEICGVSSDIDFLIEFLKEEKVLTDWVFDQDIFYGSVDPKNNVQPKHLDAELYFFSVLLNDKKNMHHQKTRGTRASQANDVLGEAKKHELTFEPHEKCIYPTSFFCTYISSFVAFLSKYRKYIEKNQAKKTESLINVVLKNEPGERPMATFLIDSKFGFIIRGYKQGFRVFIPPKYLESSFACFIFVHGMLEKVNKEILGINLNFAVRVRIKGKLKNLRKLRQSAGKLQDVFNEFSGTKTFKVAKNISGIENYLRDLVH